MISYSASIKNTDNANTVELSVNGKSQNISLKTKEGGVGSSVSGGEMLFLAVAVCYLNDLYREAENLGIRVEEAIVSVSGEHNGKPGSKAEKITYTPTVVADASEHEILELIAITDKLAEVPNTLREANSVTMVNPIAKEIGSL